MKNKNIFESFKNAFCGFKTAFLYERNFKIHIFMAVSVIVFSFLLKVDLISFIVVLLSVCLVLTAELVNTAIEAMIDLYCGKVLSPYAKIAKDTAAAAVLISSVCSVVVGIVVFGKKIIAVLGVLK